MKKSKRSSHKPKKSVSHHLQRPLSNMTSFVILASSITIFLLLIAAAKNYLNLY